MWAALCNSVSLQALRGPHYVTRLARTFLSLMEDLLRPPDSTRWVLRPPQSHRSSYRCCAEASGEPPARTGTRCTTKTPTAMTHHIACATAGPCNAPLQRRRRGFHLGGEAVGVCHFEAGVKLANCFCASRKPNPQQTATSQLDYPAPQVRLSCAPHARPGTGVEFHHIFSPHSHHIERRRGTRHSAVAIAVVPP